MSHRFCSNTAHKHSLNVLPLLYAWGGGLGGVAVRVLVSNLLGRRFESRAGRFMLESCSYLPMSGGRNMTLAVERNVKQQINSKL